MDKKKIINIIISIYLVIMTIIVNKIGSDIFNENLWPNERFVIVTVSSILFIILLFTMYRLKMNFIKMAIFYQIIIIVSYLIMIPSYDMRFIMCIPMLFTLIYGIGTGMLSCVTIITALTFAMGKEQEYLICTIVICVLGCLFVTYLGNRTKSIIGFFVFVFASFYINGIFQYYYTEQFDYGFAFSTMKGIMISTVVVIGYYLFNNPLSIRKFSKDDSDLLMKMKNKNMSLYYHSVEVGELAFEGCKKIECNKKLVLAGGYLHDIGKLQGNNYVKEGLKISGEFKIPRQIKSIIIEHNLKYRRPSTKESVIVMMADSVVMSIELLKSKNKEVDEKKIIDNVFGIRINSGALYDSGLDIKEINEIRQGFIRYFNA